MSRPTAVIVDPLGSGSHLSPLFHRAGWDTVAVVTDAGHKTPFIASLRPADHIDVLNAEGAGQIVEQLKGRLVAAVLPGTETGVEIADEIAESFGVPGNGTHLSRCRRDKAAMGDRVRAVGVPAAEHVAASEFGTLRDWIAAHGRWPVVVKPRTSAGSDGVAVCNSMAEAEAAFHRVVGRTNRLGSHNDSVVCQEFLHGQQYLVNSASVAGRLYVAEIWSFDSTYDGTHQVYDKQILLPPYGKVQDRIVAYVHDVLDALEIKYGAAHTEVVLTSRGPILIEVAARMTGLIEQQSLIAATGHNHITLTADCYIAPEQILARPPRYTVRKALGIVALRSPVDGHISEGLALERIRAMPAFAGIMGGSVEPGAPVRRTRDLFTSPGLVYLLADDAAEIERAVAAVREIESSGLYAPGGS